LDKRLLLVKPFLRTSPGSLKMGSWLLTEIRVRTGLNPTALKIARSGLTRSELFRNYYFLHLRLSLGGKAPFGSCTLS